MAVDIEKLKQISAERLYEDEGFLSGLREKYGDEEGEKKFKELEAVIIKKVDDFIYLNDEDKIREAMDEFVHQLKEDTLSDKV
ncbi:MAG: hypothetical protein PHV06_03235 [bacterium]|nr:hypothetical protein [bacterium]